MALLWTDGTWTTEARVSAYRFSYPIDGVTSAIVAEADYIVQSASYTVPTLGSSATIEIKSGTTTAQTFYLVGDGPASDIGGGMLRFSRKWCTKPGTHDEYENFAYNFIGFYGVWGINVTTVSGRDRFTKVVLSRIANIYYVIAASGGDYTAASSIPSIDVQRYVINGTTYELDYLADAPPFSTATNPSRTTYDGWVSGGTEIVAEESNITRWMGPIWRRRTRYVVAL